MTPEQKQQLEQIQAQQSRHSALFDASDSHKIVQRSEIRTMLNSIDFLLSLVKSQEAPGQSAQEIAADIVRKWSEHDTNEHYGSDYLADEFGAGHLEERIATAITNAATSMRSRCVEKVKAMRRDWQIEVDACDDIITALESVSIQEQEAKQS